MFHRTESLGPPKNCSDIHNCSVVLYTVGLKLPRRLKFNKRLAYKNVNYESYKSRLHTR